MKKAFYLTLVLITFVIATIFGKYIYKLYNKEDNTEKTSFNVSAINLTYSDKLIGDYYVIRVGESLSLKLAFEPYDLPNDYKRVSWNIENRNIVSVDSKGNINGLTVGTTKVNIVSSKNNDISITINVKVIDKDDKLLFASELLSKTNLFSLGEVAKLDYSVSGKPSIYDLKWESSDSNIVSVDNGYIKCIGIGKAQVTVKSYDNLYSSTINIEVKGNYYSSMPNSIVFDTFFKVDNTSYVISNINTIAIYEGSIVTLSAYGNSGNLVDCYYEIVSDVCEIYDASDSYIKLKITGVGNITVKAISNYNKDLTTEISFTTKGYKKDKLKVIDIEDSYSLGSYSNFYITHNDIKVPMDDFYYELSNDNIKVVNNRLFMDKVGSCDVILKYKYDDTYEYKFTINITDDDSYRDLQLFYLYDSYINDNYIDIIDYDINNVKVNDKVRLIYKFYPSNSSNKDWIDLSIDNKYINYSYEVINDSLILDLEFIKSGYTDFNIKLNEISEFNYSYKFKVLENINLSFNMSKYSYLERGEVKNLNVLVNKDITNYNIEYSSSNPDIASVGIKGDIVCLDYGKSIINVKVYNDFESIEDSFELEVLHEEQVYSNLDKFKLTTKVNNIEVDLNNTLFTIGDTFNINVSYTPSDYKFGSLYSITEDDNLELLEINKKNNNYTITCNKAGECDLVFYPYTYSSYKIVYHIHVLNIMPEFILNNIEELDTLYVGETYELTTLVDWRATYNKISYNILDEDIISIKDNIINVNKEGETILQIIVDDNDSSNNPFVYQININTSNRETSVLLARYGNINLIFRIILNCLLYVFYVIVLFELFKNIFKDKLKNIFVLLISYITSVMLVLLVNVLRYNITFFDYEQYDLLLSIIGLHIGLVIEIIVLLIKKLFVKKNKDITINEQGDNN